jgi:cytochrome c oxidase subunit I
MSDVPQNRNSYLDAPHGLASWLLTKDHKRIAMLYLISITIFFAVGGLFAAGIRMELLTPRGDLWTPDLYNKLFTLHGVVMIFFFLVPSIPATLGNFLMPIMLGTKDLAFPRINLISWYLYVIGATITLAAVFNGGLDTGWTFYTPYSSVSSQTAVTMAAVGVFVTGFRRSSPV